MRLVISLFTAVGVACALAGGTAASRQPTASLYAVAYAQDGDLATALAGRARVVRKLAALHVAEVRPTVADFAAAMLGARGIRHVERVHARRSETEPALSPPPGLTTPYEWQFTATHADAVPAAVLRAAANVTVAVIDTGVDVTAPDIAAKAPQTHSILTGGSDVRDDNGHGTFVSSLATGSVTNGDGIAGFGGDAKLLVIKADSGPGSLSDVDEANAIVYAVDHGARVINLSVGGPETSFTERRGIEYAVDHDVLVVAAAGNEHDVGNPVEYPAALLQPVGSNGKGGLGLAVGASTLRGVRASFSNTGSQISLVAPGEDVFGAVSSLSPISVYPRAILLGSAAGSYGYASGTSFSSPEVAGAAALVMAANPFLRAPKVAELLKQSASGQGSWNPQTGYGLLDVAAAVRLAQDRPIVKVSAARVGNRARLTWTASVGGPFRVTVRVDGDASHVLIPRTTRTSASFAVRAKHRYVYTVSLVGTDGIARASATVSVRG